MRKNVLIAILALVVVLVSAYTAARVYTGHRVGQEIDHLRTQLHNQPDVDVRELSYDAGLLGGELNYDVGVRVPTGHPLLDLGRVLTDSPGLREWQFKGTAQVSHGPFWADNQLVLATAEQHWGLPEHWQSALPDYNGDRLITARAHIRPDGTTSGHLTGADYSGDWVTPDGQPLAMEMQGLNGTFRLFGASPGLDIQSQLDTLQIGDQAFWGTLGGASLDVSVTVEDTERWQSGMTFNANLLELASDESGTRIQDAQTEINLQQNGDRINNQMSLSLGESLIEHVDLRGLHLSLSLDNLQAEAYRGVIEHGAELGASRGFDRDAQQALLASVQALLEAGPSLRVERLSASLVNDDDLAGALYMRYPEQAPVMLNQPWTMLEHLEVDLNLMAELNAIDRISRLLAEQEARELWRTRGLERTEEQIRRSAQRRYRSTLMTLQFMPLVEVGGGKAESHLELREGSVYSDGEPVMSLGQLLNMFGV